MSEAFARSLLAHAPTSATTVLPSELAAEFWRREVIRSGTLRAIREDRIISWDRFKERAFDLRTDRPPANRVVRALFIDEVIAEHAAHPFLRRIVPPEAAASADGFRSWLTRIVPSLARIGVVEQAAHGRLVELIADLRDLERRYKAYLDEHGLFEPAWIERTPAYLGGNHVLVMPELAEDYPEFASALRGVRRLELPQGPLPQLSIYPDSRAELDAVLGAVGRLLDAGASPESIVLTVCDLERLRIRLLQSAELVEVPVSLRHGIPLSRSAAGRFLAGFGDLETTGFGLPAVKRLLLNRAVPWLGYATNARLVLAGARAGCLGGGRRPDPRWRRVAPGPERELIDLLVRDVPRIMRASSAAELRGLVYRLFARLIDRDRWGDEDERLYQRCMEELRSLADLEKRGFTIGSPYRLWMDLLEQQLYVPRDDRRGIAVLPYRVGAGLCPEHHFVVNASNTPTRVRVDRFPFLTDAERELVGEGVGEGVADRDLSAAFFHAYAVSGRTVAVSCSRISWDGPVLPPGDFVAAGLAQDAEPSVSPLEPWAAEERFAGIPQTVYPLQPAGASAYAAAARRPGAADLTTHPIAGRELIEAVLQVQRHRRYPDLVTLSAGAIESYRSCPFSYLLERVLRLREPEVEVDPDSARDIGSLYHAVLERFYAELHARGERFDPAQTPAYQERLLEIADEVTDRAPGMVPAFVYAAMRPLAARVIARVLEHDSRLIAAHTIELVEEWGRRLDLETGVYLVGRVDRVTRSPEGDLTLVDYKKRNVPVGKRQSGNSASPTGVGALPEPERAAERDAVTSIQMPVYVALLEAERTDGSVGRVETAAYYSLEDGACQLVVTGGGVDGRPVMSRERLDEIIVLVDDMVRDVAGRLVRGDYRCSSIGCEGCAFRGVCRTRFVVR